MYSDVRKMPDSPVVLGTWYDGFKFVEHGAQFDQEARAILGVLPAEFIVLRYGNVLMTLRAYNGGTLVLPSEYADLVGEHTGPTIIVP